MRLIARLLTGSTVARLLTGRTRARIVEPVPETPGGFLLLADGTSYLLLADGGKLTLT